MGGKTHTDWLLSFSEHIHLLWWLANPCCRHLLWFICLFNTHTAYLWFILQLRWMYLSYSFSERRHDQQFEWCQYTQTLSHDDVWLCASHWWPLNSSVYPVSLTWFGSFHGMVFRYFPKIYPGISSPDR